VTDAVPTLRSVNAALVAGSISCAEIVEASFARAKDLDGEGSRAFRALRESPARGEAAMQDSLRAAGRIASPLDRLSRPPAWCWNGLRRHATPHRATGNDLK